MSAYVFKTYQGKTFNLEDLSPAETKIYLCDIDKVIKEYSEESKVYELTNGKILACIYADKSSILFSSKKDFEDLEYKSVFLKPGRNMRLIGFQLLEPGDLILIDKSISNPIERSCEGESFELPGGLVYVKEDYGRHGYIFMNKFELNLYCSEWLGKQFR